MSITSSMVEFAAKEWVKLYKKAPIATIISTLLGIAISVTGIYFIEKHDQEKRQSARKQNISYQKQVQDLNQTEKSIKSLLVFIDEQKDRLADTEDTINALKSEHQKLKPLVESDRQLVEAIFVAQEERNLASVWRERLIGFGFGVLASLLASTIWFISSILLRKKPV